MKELGVAPPRSLATSCWPRVRNRRPLEGIFKYQGM